MEGQGSWSSRDELLLRTRSNNPCRQGGWSWSLPLQFAGNLGTDLTSALREGISSVCSTGSVTVRQVLADPSLGMLSEPFPWPLAGHYLQKEEMQVPVIFRKEGMAASMILLEFSPSRLSPSVPQLEF